MSIENIYVCFCKHKQITEIIVSFLFFLILFQNFIDKLGLIGGEQQPQYPPQYYMPPPQPPQQQPPPQAAATGGTSSLVGDDKAQGHGGA